MKKIVKTMLIIGTVIGSGFSSGKEIIVFFSRFGTLSYFFITLSFFMFWGLFFLIMQRGPRAIERLDKSRFFLIISIIVSLIFTSSMFAGIRDITNSENLMFNVFLSVILLGACVIVSQKKVDFLAKINTIFIPIILIIMIYCISNKLGFGQVSSPTFAFIGLFYAILYVGLNTSFSSIVIARGEKLSKRENMFVSFLASFVLYVMLLLINMAILNNPLSFSANMPMIFLAEGVGKSIMCFVVLIGCLTTLFSLVFTTTSSFRSLGFTRLICLILAVFTPFAVSFVGFGDIISYIYPIASILGMSLFWLYR